LEVEVVPLIRALQARFPLKLRARLKSKLPLRSYHRYRNVKESDKLEKEAHVMEEKLKLLRQFNELEGKKGVTNGSKSTAAIKS
jgi:hypothetical protein